MGMDEYDIIIMGGGIMGLATASALATRYPRKRLALLEKEPRVASHQTGHNSGVIHSGIYYRPGSLKATLCVKGAQALMNFCENHQIPTERCGKVIVATCAKELPRLTQLYQRGLANGVLGCALVGPERLRELEPHAAGIQALHVPSTGIVDYTQVAHALVRIIETKGGILCLSTCVRQMVHRQGLFILKTSNGEMAARCLINCAGLHADRLARMSGASLNLRIIPFRGEYFELVPNRSHLVRGLIYAVPDPCLPFLGVHLSRRLDGRVEAGPNAVLALKREGYRWQDVSLFDLTEMLLFPGFWRMAARHWKTGLMELTRSFHKRSFLRSVQRLVPQIQEKDLAPTAAGVRAQAVDWKGSLLDDFHLIQERQILHVCNAPSPAATASLAIGEFIADAAAKQFWGHNT